MDDAQMAALVAQWRKQLENTMSELKLRQWCVEKAIEAGSAANVVSANADDLLKFITEPFAELFGRGG